MDKVLNAIDRFILHLGKIIAERPRLSGFFISLIILIGLTGWMLAAHYHRINELLLIPNEQATETTTTPSSNNITTNTGAPDSSTSVAQLSDSGRWRTIIVKRGDNLQRIFKKLHLSQQQLAEITALGEATKPLAKMKPGLKIQLLISNDHQLQELIFPLDEQNNLTIVRDETGFTVTSNQKPLQQALAESFPKNIPTTFSANSNEFGNAKFGLAVVKKSFYQAGIEAGLSRKQILQLVRLYTLNANIIKKIRPGDQLNVVYQPDTPDSAGAILAAELIIKKTPYQIFRYSDPQGNTNYYTADGVNLHPPIVRAPLAFTHISSYFSAHRWEPILHFFRPHYGVDYAAHFGTPIKAAGDGHIIFLGVRGGYGKTIMIKHLFPYETLYAHLSHFAKGIKNGTVVKQGEIIGYVGNTGLSTGSHLHFEIRVNNIPRNPLTVALPTGTHLAKAYQARFFAEKDQLLAMMNINQTTLAAAQSPTSGK